MSTKTRRRGVLRVADLLASPHGVDSFAELVRPLWSSTDLRAEVTSVNRQTPDSVTLTLRPNGLWAGFAAGQYTQVTVEVDGVRHTRCFSLAGSAHGRAAGRLELTVKAQGGVVSSYLVAQARPGLVVGLAPAQGGFTLPEPRPERLLLVSGGSGITPVLSILRTLCDEGHDRPVTFLHYAPTRAAALYRGEVAALAARHPNVRVVEAYTQAPGTGHLDGRFAPDHLAAADPRWAEAEAYVCGPRPLMDAVVACFAGVGRAGQAHVEAFVPASAVSSLVLVVGVRPGGGGGRRGPVRGQRLRGARRRPHPARPGRVRRAHAPLRLPHGHLPHVHPPAAGRRRPPHHDRRADHREPGPACSCASTARSATSNSISEPQEASP